MHLVDEFGALSDVLEKQCNMCFSLSFEDRSGTVGCFNYRFRYPLSAPMSLFCPKQKENAYCFFHLHYTI